MQAPNVLTRRSFLRRAAVPALGAAACTATIRDLRLMNSLMAAQNPNPSGPYKALVCLFLAGGNDANNWIVPTDTTTFNEYTANRGIVALPESSLRPLYQAGTSGALYTDSDGHTYGFHPACAELQTLWGEDKLAAIMNIGTLVRPTTKAQYNSNPAFYRPPQLFSHSDQVTQWQTSIPDQPPITGWGGRVADIYNAVANPSGNISMSVSLNGANTFEVGNLISQYHVSTDGAVTLGGNLMSGNSARVKAMKDILALSHANLQRTAYADVLDRAIFTGDLLNANIAPYRDPTDSPASYGPTPAQDAAAPWRWNTGLTGIYTTAVQPNGLGGFPNTTLGRQLKMIARLIAARGPTAFNMKRQIFFCSVGGYDTHTAQVSVNGTNQPTNPAGSHYVLLNEVSRCMFAFQRAMEQLGVSDNVTTFTASDFSRTFFSNGQGTDHSWGAHSLVMGGAVNGGQTYGKLPTFAINGPDGIGNGAWLPTTSVDQHGATLAKWYGLDQSEIESVLPNITRFPGSYGAPANNTTGYMGFMKPA